MQYHHLTCYTTYFRKADRLPEEASKPVATTAGDQAAEEDAPVDDHDYPAVDVPDMRRSKLHRTFSSSLSSASGSCSVTASLCALHAVREEPPLLTCVVCSKDWV